MTFSIDKFKYYTAPPSQEEVKYLNNESYFNYQKIN